MEAKKSVWIPSSNTVELEERITNLLLKLKKKKIRRILKRYHPTPLTFYIFFVLLQIHMAVTPIDS